MLVQPYRRTQSALGADIIHRAFDALASEEQLGGDDARETEVETVRRLHFQVLLDDPAEADQFAILDGHGEEMLFYAQTPHLYVIRGDDHKALTRGRSRHLFVEEGAAEIALLRDEVELRRVPIALEPGDETLLRL